MNRRTMILSTPAPGRRRLQAVTVGMAMTLLAAIGTTAWAQAAPPAAPASMERGGPGLRGGDMRGGDMRGGELHGGGMHGGGMRGGMGGMMFGGSPERAGRMIDRLLDGLSATDAQRTQTKQIATAAAADMKSQTDAGRGLRQRGLQLFTAPTVDAAAAEQLRQQTLQQHDQMSRRMTQAMLDVARVLTPEQRAKIGERMRDRQARMQERMGRMEREGPRR